MKIRFLGTAAAEGIPGIFCGCKNCVEARARGGRFVRTRSQLIIDDRLLIDFGPDTYHHSLTYGIDLSKISDVLITHVHSDHFYPDEIKNRFVGYSSFMEHEALTFHGSQDIVEPIERLLSRSGSRANRDRIITRVLRPYETVRVLDYDVTPLPARHGTEHPYLYLINDGKSSFLMLNDTGRLIDEHYDFLSSSGVKVDAVSYDCTYGNIDVEAKFGVAGHHMGLLDDVAVRDRLISEGIADERTLNIATHFSHNPVGVGYEEMLVHTDGCGFLLAFDGMSIEI
ncbi:MAG: hypothetical protein IJX38_02270 [Clostridia bacterium]|nr:hypothetical protein [Clostridia bacterium]MBQ8371754.1 hypothetical protein [Clostridia bacterium]